MVKNFKIIALVALLAMNQSYAANEPISKDAVYKSLELVGAMAGASLGFEYSLKGLIKPKALPKVIKGPLAAGKGALAASLGIALITDLTGPHKSNCTRHLILGAASGAMFAYPATKAVAHLMDLKYGKSAIVAGGIITGALCETATYAGLKTVVCDTDHATLK